jgi:hypothetical protein
MPWHRDNMEAVQEPMSPLDSSKAAIRILKGLSSVGRRTTVTGKEIRAKGTELLECATQLERRVHIVRVKPSTRPIVDEGMAGRRGHMCNVTANCTSNPPYLYFYSSLFSLELGKTSNNTFMPAASFAYVFRQMELNPLKLFSGTS